MTKTDCLPALQIAPFDVPALPGAAQGFSGSRVSGLRAGREDAPPVALPLTKRLLDVSLAVVALVLLCPVLILAAVAVKSTSRGSVLFCQTRVGLRGKPFRMLKFRSMHVDAEARRAHLLQRSERAGVCFKMKHDPRLTMVGAVLRRYSIDELPQLWNVLRGEMSIVGPRPALPEEVAQYSARALGRLQAVPGITGIWQVSGRAEVSFEQMVEMDLDYVRRRSLRLDLWVISRTAGAVLGGTGAY